MWQYHWPLLIPALGYGAWGVVKRPRSALSYYPFVSLATMLMVGSEGAYRYYFIPLCLAAGLGTALGLGALLEARPAAALLPAAALVALLGLYTWRAYTYFTPANFVPGPPVETGGERNRILAAVDAAPEPVLAEEVGYQAIRHRQPVIDDPYLAQILLRYGRWDDAAIVAGLRERRYTLVVVKPADDALLRQRWGDAFVDALYANYRQTEPQVYRPK
jgi:hypothetical protein